MTAAAADADDAAAEVAAAVADVMMEEVDSFAFFFGAGAAMAREKRRVETMTESFMMTSLVSFVLESLKKIDRI